jgi:hypothetical protein
MTFRSTSTAIAFIIATTALTPVSSVSHAQLSSVQQSQAAILNRDQAAAILPPEVFFRGQSASIQARNSAGLRSPNGKLILVAAVDTSGYSSALQQTYQAYLLAELPFLIAGKKLPPGAYGFGFVAGNKLVVMDIGGNEVVRSATTRDESLARPNPLQILPDTASGVYRLYLGRNYVSLALAEK